MARKKRLNKRLVLLISVVLVVSMGLGLVIWIVNRPKDPKYYYNQAQKALVSTPKNYSLASQMFQRAIAESRDNVTLRNEYRYDYAQMCFDRITKNNDPGITAAQRSESFRMGIGMLKAAIQDDLRFVKARRRLAELYWSDAWRAELSKDPSAAEYAYGAWTALIEQLDAILAVEQDPELYYRRAVAEQYLGKDDDEKRAMALNDYRKAVAISKTGDKNLVYRLQLASYLRSLGRKTEAENQYKEAIKTNPKKARAYLGYSAFLFLEKRDEQALKQINAAITNDPSSADGYIALARTYIRKKEFDKALDVLKKAPKEQIIGAGIYDMEGGLHWKMGNLTAAAASYRAGLDAIDKQIAENKHPNAIGRLQSEKVKLVAQLAKVMLIVCEMQGSKDKAAAKKAMAEAERYNDLLVKLEPGSRRQLKIAGRIAFIKGNLSEAMRCMEQARRLREESDLKNRLEKTIDPELTQLLWRIYERSNAPSKAKAELKRLVSLGNYITPEQMVFYQLKLAGHELNDGNYQIARNIVNRVLNIAPDNKEAKSLSKTLDIAQKGTIPSGGQEIDPTSRAIVYRLVEDYIIQEQYDKAVELLKRLLKSDPKDKRVLVNLVSVLVRTGRKDEAMVLMDQAIKDSPDDKNLVTLRDVLKTNDPKKAFEIQMKALDGVKDPIDRNIQKYRLCMSRKKKAEAEKYFKLAEKANPSDRRIIEIAFTTALRNKNWDRAREVINRIDKAEKLLRELYLGQLLYAQGEYDDAIVMFKNVLKARPNLQRLRLLLTNCYLKKKDFDKAQRELLAVVENDSSNVSALVGLARLARQEQNPQDFEKWIRLAYKHNAGKANPFVREAFLTLEVEKKDPKKAILEREREFKKNKTNLQNAVRLAVLYERDKQIDKARAKYEYVFKNVSNKVGFAPFIAQFYARIGRPAKGYAVFDSLLKTAKSPKAKASVLTGYGDFLLNIGEISTAEGMYKKAIKADDADPRGYRGLGNCYAFKASELERAGKASQAKADWNHSVNQLQKVLTLEPDDTKTKKLMYYRQAKVGMYQEAIDGFRSLLRDNPEDKDAAIGIARVYQDQREPEKALAQLDGIIKQYPQYAQAHIDRARVYESVGELKKADVDYREALDIRNNPAWAMDRAKLNIRMGDGNNALRIYSDTIRAFPDYPDAYLAKLELLVSRKDWNQVKLVAEAGMAREKFAKLPNFALGMAEVYKQRKQPGKEMEMLKKAAQIAPTNQRVVRAYLKALAMNNDYATLQTEAKKYIDDPKQKPGVMGILAFANARRNPNTIGALNEFLTAVKAARPDEISYVLGLMQQAMGLDSLTTNAMQLRKIHPKFWGIPFAVGRAYSLEKKYAQAIKEYNDALGLTRNPVYRVGILSALASSYEGLNDHSNTEKIYRRILKMDPNNKAALNNLAYLLVENLNRPKEALTLSKKALMLEPSNVNVVDTYAWILARMGEYKKAMSSYNEIRDRAIESVEILYHIAFVAEKLKQYEVSKEYYQQALEAVKMHKNHFLAQPVQQGLERVKQKLNQE